MAERRRARTRRRATAARTAPALLGTDAPLARDRPRRVPSRVKDPQKGKGLGAGAPLLNCSAESRRHAADGDSRRRRIPQRRKSLSQPSLVPFLLTIASSTALGYAVARGLIRCGAWPPRAVGWGIIAFLTAYNLLPSYLRSSSRHPKNDSMMNPCRRRGN